MSNGGFEGMHQRLLTALALALIKNKYGYYPLISAQLGPVPQRQDLAADIRIPLCGYDQHMSERAERFRHRADRSRQ